MNNGFTYSIGFQWANSPLNNLLGRLNGINSTIDSMRLRINSNTNAMNRFANSGNNSVSGLNSGMTNLLGTIGTVGLATKSMHDVMDRQSSVNAINFASGGVVQGTENINHIRETVEKLGLPLKESMDGFKLLDASIMGTGMSQKFARDIFDSTGMAATVLGMKAEQTSAAYRALGQMASKGVVSMEELRGQLGDALPGAASIAARAMNMPIDKFNKMVESGNLLAKDFLPKFAAEMKNTFEGKVSASINSATANYARFQNSLSDLSVIVGERLLPPVLSFMKNYLIPAAGWIGKHIDLLTNLGVGVGSVVLGIKAYHTWTWLSTAATWLWTGSIEALSGASLLGAIRIVGLSGTIELLSAAMWANPIGIFVGIFVALGVAAVYCWNKFESFRAAMMGTWYVIKEFGKTVYNDAIKPLISFGKILFGIFSGDFDMLKNGMSELADTFERKIGEMTGKYESAGSRLAGAWNTGWQEGIRDFHYGDNMPKLSQDNFKRLGLSDAYTMGMTGKEKIIGNSKYFWDTPKGEELKADKGVKDNIKGITEGGKSTKVITFQNVTLVKEFNQNVKNIQEGATEAKEIIIREFLQLLNSANQMQ